MFKIRKGSVIEGQELGGDLQKLWVLHMVIFRNCHFKKCNFKQAMIRKCVFENCEFTDCSFSEAELVACNFLRCKLVKCNLNYAFTSKNIGNNSGAFQDVNFISCNFSGAYFFFPLISNTRFENCKLNRVYFDGSRLSNVSFIGEIDGAWFRGYSVLASKNFLGLFNRINPKHYRNKMENVDFSSCKILDVTFSHGIDLSNCIFNADANAIYIENPKYFYEKVIELIKNEWQGEDEEKAMKIMYGIYYNEDKWEQPNDFVDLTLSSNPEVAYMEHKLFTLFRKAQELQPDSK